MNAFCPVRAFAVLALALAILCPTQVLGQEPDTTAQRPDTTSVTVTTTAQHEQSTFRRIKAITGFFLDLNAGYNYRFNTFSTDRPLLDESPVGYSSLDLSVYDLSVDLGLAGTSLLELSYESPYPRTDFQEQALDARKDQTKGLETYTAGINLLPLWRFLLPESWPDFVKWLPAVEIRYTHELTQNTAIAERESLLLNTVSNLDGSVELDDLIFQRVETGASFSFKTRYEFGSVSIPIYVWNWNDMESNTALRLGVSRWSYSRVYSTRFPKFNTPIVYEADAAGRGLLLNFQSYPRSGFRTDITLGIGRGTFQTDDRELSGALPFFYETSDLSANPLSLYGEGAFSYRFSFFPKAPVTMYLEPGVDMNMFNVTFNSFGEIVSPGTGDGTPLSTDGSSSIQHFDFLVRPWIRFSLSI